MVVGTVVSTLISLLSARFWALTAVPAITVPVGSPTAVMLEMVLNKPTLVAAPAFAPATVSVTAAPVASVPTTVKLIAVSLPPEVIVTFWATALLIVPSIPAETLPAGVPSAVMLEMVRKEFMVVTALLFPPVTVSENAEPNSFVPATMKVIPASLPAEVIVTFSATALVTVPVPVITRAASFITAAAVEIKAASTEDSAPLITRAPLSAT